MYKGLCGAGDQSGCASEARLLIEQAEALGEPPEDPLLLFSVLYGFWVANYVAFNGDAMRELAAQFLALAQNQGATVPLMIGHRLMGMSLLQRRDIAEGRAHLDQGDSALRSCRTPSAGDAIWSRRRGGRSCPIGRWTCGCLDIPKPRSRTSNTRVKDAREIGQAATLMYALNVTSLTLTFAEITPQRAAQCR